MKIPVFVRVGFIVDLLDQVAMMVDFQYELYPVADGNYGHRQPNGRWNGVIGEIIDRVRYQSLLLFAR